MIFYLLNTSLEIVDVIDTYKSAIWTERFYKSGDFELYIPATDTTINQMQKERFIVRGDDMTKAMIIEKVQITTDAEQGNYLIVTGRSLSSILSRRIVWKQTTFSGNVEKIIRRMIEQSIISPEESGRQISNFTLGNTIGLTNTLRVQYTGDNVETAIQDLCQTYKIGYKVSLDFENKQFIFELYQGTDRSYNQSANPYVVFSNDFENLLSSEYTTDNQNFKNVAQVAGEGQGTARTKVSVGTASGLGRYEMFVNASGVSTNDGELDAATYQSLLTQEGQAQIATHAVSVSVNGEVESNYTYKLNQDYFLGDIVEVVNEYGIAMTPRVVEVIESYSDTGFTCIPKFEND